MKGQKRAARSREKEQKQEKETSFSSLFLLFHLHLFSLFHGPPPGTAVPALEARMIPTIRP